MDVLNNENKVIFAESLPTVNWCELLSKNANVPTLVGWKIIMKGFGKYFKDYMSCPIKKNITFNRMHADSKMLLFAPSAQYYFQLIINVVGDKGQKEFANVSLIVEIGNS